MKMSDVNFDAAVFENHPPGWQSASELVAGFTLAWALELRERLKLSPHAPFAEGVRDRLPARYRFDTLGKLVSMRPGATSAALGMNQVARLTTICGAWQIFDLLNQTWRIKPYDFLQFSNTLSFVTGGTERRSLFHDLSANLSKSLLAVRVRRASSESDELDLAEEWFITGDSSIVSIDARGNPALVFHFTGQNAVPVGLLAHEFAESVWSTARVTVDHLGPDRVIAMQRDRIESLDDLLTRGGQRALDAQMRMSFMEFNWFNYWPGWTD